MRENRNRKAFAMK